MKHLLIALSLIVLITGCSKSPEEKQKRLYGDAVEALDEFKFDEAQAVGQQLSQAVPGSPMARFVTGLAHERRLHFYDALGEYVAITNSHPSFADAHIAAWRMYMELNLMPEAMMEATEYRKLLPQDGVAAVAMALTMIRSELAGRAHAYLDTAVTQGVDASVAAMIHARAYIVEDMPHQADSVYEAGLVGADGRAEVYAEAANYLEALGLVDSAVVMSRKALTASKNNFDQAVRHARLATRNNYFLEVDNVLAQLRSNEVPVGVVKLLEAFRYDAAGTVTLAKEAIDQSNIQGDANISTRMYESEIKIKASDELALMNNYQVLSALLVREGYDPEFQEVMFYLLGLQAGSWLQGTMGIPFLKDVRPKFQNRAPLRSLFTLALYESGRVEEFNQLVDEILKFHRNQVDWVTGLGTIYADREVHDYDKMAEYFTQALELNPWYQPAFAKWVATYRFLGRYDDIAKLFETYAHFPERFPQLAMLEGICLVEGGMVERGMDVYAMNAPMARGDEKLHRQMYQALRKHWSTAQMGQFADWLKENGGQNAHLLTLAATLKVDIGEKEAGLALADAVLQVKPDLVDAAAQRARALYLMGQTDEAIALLQRNIEIDQFHVPSNYWLARLLALQGRDANKAQDLARRAVFDSNQGINEWCNLSYVYLKTGRFDLARGEASKMTRSFAGEPLPLFCLGMALYMEQKPVEAKNRLQEAIDKGLVGEALIEAKDVLSKLRS